MRVNQWIFSNNGFKPYSYFSEGLDMPKAYSNSNVLLHRGFITAIASFFVLIALIFQANAQEVLAQVQSTANGTVTDGSKSQ